MIKNGEVLTLNGRKKVEIKLAEYAGFCFGVSRAAAMIEEETQNALKTENFDPCKPLLYTVGELIHNRSFVAQLENRGVKAVSIDEAFSLPEGSKVVARTHGIKREDFSALKARGLNVLDASCPYVKKIQRLAQEHTKGGVPLFIMGDSKHPEVESIRSYAEGKSFVFSSLEETKDFFDSLSTEDRCLINEKGLVLVSQTTFSVVEWKKNHFFIKNLYTNAKIFDTICCVTETRQQEAELLAENYPLVVVVGGKNSSNTKKLYEVAKAKTDAVHVETAEELDSLLGTSLLNYEKIAITAGASTPDSIIQEVINHMAEIINGAEGTEELSFQELLDQNFKTLHTGERVCGTISAVSPTEIHVDFGTKHTGILPYDEITDESGVNLEEIYKVGDTIEVMPTKFSDTEGTVMLSKKRLDADKNWGIIAGAAEDKDLILNGVVKDVIKGGVIVSCNNVRVFVPASQTGVPKDEPLEALKGKKVSLKIIEVDDSRKRAVGSIRLAERAQQKQAVDAFFATAEVGQKFKGTVRSLTSYGAFVNIGAVDGMVHITELSWGRLKPPAEVLKVGDSIDVYIKAIVPEKKRVSLGYKTEENNPWNIFAARYNVGDDVTVKVVSLMAFGAFAEIIPGVDGLIHNTQLAAKPVSAPASVVNVGDTLEVKIIAIDEEKKRISLSRKALLAPEELGEGFEIVEEAEAAPAEEAAE